MVLVSAACVAAEDEDGSGASGSGTDDDAIVTSLSEDVSIGATVLFVDDIDGIEDGDTVTITDGANTETTTVSGDPTSTRRQRRATPGSFTIANALANAYTKAAASITVTPKPGKLGKVVSSSKSSKSKKGKKGKKDSSSSSSRSSSSSSSSKSKKSKKSKKGKKAKLIRRQSAARSISPDVAAGVTGAVAMVMFLAFVVFKESRRSQPTTLPLANTDAEDKLVSSVLKSASRATRVQPETSTAHSPLLGVSLA